MKTNQLIALAIANKPSNSNWVSQRFARKSNHQFLISTAVKTGYQMSLFQTLWFKLKYIQLVKFNTL